jgi:rfaE bifunctional protein nucleotidyltransferase chain/domain
MKDRDYWEEVIRRNFATKRIEWLTGGWRKLVARIDDNRLVAVVSKESLNKRAIKRSLRLEEKLGGRGLLEIREVGEHRLLLMKYIEGEVRWRWGAKESEKVGEKLRELHELGVAHLDMKPGNVIWSGGRIRAVIDFEECRINKKYIKEDLINTLSWVLVAGGDKRKFLSAYGGGWEGGTMEKALTEKLKIRMSEGNPQAFIALAKERLETSKKQVKDKVFKVDDLREFREANKDRKIIFTCGAWELIHWGHLSFLRKIKKKGDLLVVGVESDDSRRRVSPKQGSIVGERTRAETLAYFELVDKVVIVEEDDIKLPLEKLKPDWLVVTRRDIEEGKRKEEELNVLKSGGGTVKVIEHCGPKISSKQMVVEVAMQKIKHELFGKGRRKPILKMKNGHNPKIVKVEELEALGEKLRKAGKSVVFTSGSADLFHLGHARFFQKAKSLGEVLVVGLPSNRSIAALKGPGRPIVDETARAKVLTELTDVDWVVIFDERTILKCLEALRPEVFFTVKEEWNSGLANCPEAKLMKELGGKIVQSERMAPYISASMMIEKAAGELIKRTFNKVLETAERNPVIDADFDPFAPESQLEAREKGFYSKVLEEVGKSNKCVFCDLKEKYIIKELGEVVLTVALYPYADGHLLIIPKRHIESAGEMTKKEWEQVKELIREGEKMLKKHLNLENYWVLVREGDGIAAGKTVRHMHFHILPYNSEVVKMGQTKLNILPIDLAAKLKA